jgi:hypothetical protein
MEKSIQTNPIETFLGIVIGVILDAYLIWDVSYYGILNKHSPLEFVWYLHSYVEKSPLGIAVIFSIVQISLTIVYCILFSTYFVSQRKIIPPSLVLLGASIPLLFITGLLSFQFFQETHAQDPINASFLLAFFLAFFYFILVYSTGTHFDTFVKSFIGAYYDEKQIEENMETYSSSLGFESIMAVIEDQKWLKDYASLSVVKSEKNEKKEAFLRLKKLGTHYYLCISIFQQDNQSLVLFTFYELNENRFGKELRISNETKSVFNPQIELIKKKLNLSEILVEVGFTKKACRFATKITKVPLEKIVSYKMHALIVVLNIIAIIMLSYLNSIRTVDSTLAIAIYTLILMVSLEVFRLKAR